MDLVSRTYDFFAAPMEALGVRRRRRELLSAAAGRVLEVGVGTGLNLPLYPAGRVTEIVATDPNPNMLWQARARAALLRVPVQLLQASAEALPFRDQGFDTVVATLVFCSVDDPDRGLAEIRRVLRPGGRLLMLEHVRSPHRIASALQGFVTPMTVRLAGGCHHDRDTVGAVRQAGFQIEAIEPRSDRVFVTIRASKAAA